MKQPLLAGVALMLSLSVTVSVHAFSVGDIEVQSHLGQPFVGEVELRVKPHERNQGFVVVIGSEEDYEAERLPRAPVIDTLRPTVIMGPPDVVRVASQQPMDTPAFNLILLVRTGQVTILRNYRITLPEAPASSLLAKSPAPQSEAARHVTPAFAPDVADTMPPLPEVYGPVLRGETLYKIMRSLQVPEALIWQISVLVWKRNPEHFVKGNIHGLHIGAYLRLPTDVKQALADLPRADAQQIVTDQWEAWQAPQRPTVVAQQQETAPPTRHEVYADTVPTETSAEVPPGRTTVTLPDDSNAERTTRTQLDAVLQGLEDRLSQRFALPPLTPEGSNDNTLTFVSARDLKQAIEGLEVRLSQRLEQALGRGVELDQVSASVRDTQPLRRSLRPGSGIEAALTSLFATGSVVPVLIVQNLLLVLVGAGFAWRWYRKRA